jgi:hypothetical protein
MRKMRTLWDANGFFTKKSTVSGPNSRIGSHHYVIGFPVRTVRETVGRLRFMAFLTTHCAAKRVFRATFNNFLPLFVSFRTPHTGYFSHKLRRKTGFQGYILALLTTFFLFKKCPTNQTLQETLLDTTFRLLFTQIAPQNGFSRLNMYMHALFVCNRGRGFY